MSRQLSHLHIPHTHICMSHYYSHSMQMIVSVAADCMKIKYANDTASKMSKNDEHGYNLVTDFLQWCSDNYLELRPRKLL